MVFKRSHQGRGRNHGKVLEVMDLMGVLEFFSKEGIRVHPLKNNTKVPVFYNGWKHRATTDIEKLKSFFFTPSGELAGFNVGIRTGLTDVKDRHLMVIDVDVKEGKKGWQTVLNLELQHKVLPETLTVITPSGGRHYYYYYSGEVLGNGTQSLGPDIDHRSEGGLLVAPASTIDNGEYKFENFVKIAELPEWIRESLLHRALYECEPTYTESSLRDIEQTLKAHEESIEAEASMYLMTAPVAIQGEGGNETTFKVAAKLKDIGVEQLRCSELMYEQWNPNCKPMWSQSELHTIVNNAYKYGKNLRGSDILDTLSDFSDIEPTYDAHDEGGKDLGKLIKDFNKRFFFTTIENKNFVCEVSKEKEELVHRYTVQSFKEKFCNTIFKTEQLNALGQQKVLPATQIWLESPKRRKANIIFDMSYKGGQEDWKKEQYNTFRGFPTQPESFDEASQEARDALKTLEEHIFENVCRKNSEESAIFWSWLAHTVAKPTVKLTSVPVLISDARGSGKSILSVMMSLLLGEYGLMVKAENILGNYNSIIKNKKFVGIEELYNAHSKRTDTLLRDLITSPFLTIQEKYVPEYTQKNHINLMITSNYTDCVEVHMTERRYKIFEVSSSWVGKERKWKALEPFINVNKLDNGLLMGALLNPELLGVSPNKMVLNPSAVEYKIMSLSDIDNHIMESIENGFLFSLIQHKKSSEQLYGTFVLPCKELYSDALSDRYMKTRRTRSYFTYVEYQKRLEYLIGRGTSYQRVRVNGEKVLALCFTEKDLDAVKEKIISNWNMETKIYLNLYDIMDVETESNVIPFGDFT